MGFAKSIAFQNANPSSRWTREGESGRPTRTHRRNRRRKGYYRPTGPSQGLPKSHLDSLMSPAASAYIVNADLPPFLHQDMTQAIRTTFLAPSTTQEHLANFGPWPSNMPSSFTITCRIHLTAFRPMISSRRLAGPIPSSKNAMSGDAQSTSLIKPCKMERNSHAENLAPPATPTSA